jgi:hypothetical protein
LLSAAADGGGRPRSPQASETERPAPGTKRPEPLDVLAAAADYVPVLLARLADGRIDLEAHRDVYRRGEDPWALVHRLAGAADLGSRPDWRRAAEVRGRREGLAREVSGQTPGLEAGEGG